MKQGKLCVIVTVSQSVSQILMSPANAADPMLDLVRCTRI